jgi:hypothetical protein
LEEKPFSHQNAIHALLVQTNTRASFSTPKKAFEGHFFNVEIVINGQYWRSRHADDDVLNAEHPADIPTTINFKFVFGSEIQKTILSAWAGREAN